jgi:hypothetical protein
VVEEAELVFGTERKVAALVSIGTGLGKAIVYKSPGKVETKFRKNLAQRLGDLATTSDIIAERAFKRYMDAAPLYWRFNVDRGLDGISLEEWEQLGEVEQYSRDYLKQAAVNKEVENIVAALLMGFPRPHESVKARETDVAQSECISESRMIEGPPAVEDYSQLYRLDDLVSK